MKLLPGRPGVCERCRKPIVWGITVAGPNGPGGKSQPFDPHENPEGNVAVWSPTRGRMLARALPKGESHDITTELRAMPHAATCTPTLPIPDPPAPANVTNLTHYRTQKRGTTR